LGLPVVNVAGIGYNTFESMCVAMQVDPQGDPDLIAAQSDIKAKIEDWHTMNTTVHENITKYDPKFHRCVWKRSLLKVQC